MGFSPEREVFTFIFRLTLHLALQMSLVSRLFYLLAGIKGLRSEAKPDWLLHVFEHYPFIWTRCLAISFLPY
uniref:Uncharacterized protein n=1 Tax=Candidatus Kentrum sp. MB TaxID=2138164 RepID=A0A450XM39_9GAMM|nr:MAG: hypothetical protein BECKMB1821I_GA0114274_101528 [Candidatus Kentron sp. MB]VFK75196.1 MAG: hypothetical protein BECKMB1821H_GA0114242_101728 [Candidatus Kentron sp. MB]